MEGTKGTLNEIKSAKMRRELTELLAERGRIKREKAALEDDEKALNLAIIPILKKLGYKSVTAPDDQGEVKSFGLVTGTSTSLDKKMLLTKGVPPETIAECTKVTSYETISVRDIREPGREE